jgi:signal transduction histidine kinase
MKWRASVRRYRVELLWAAFAAANFAAMIAWPSWETIPFHFVWISLTLVYGFRVWNTRGTLIVLGIVFATTGASIMFDAFRGIQLWGELFEVPLMSAMFLAMVWHARRRVDAQRIAEQRAEQRRSLLERIDAIIERLLVLATADQPDFVRTATIDLEPFLEDVFVRWSEVAPRAWRLGPLASGLLQVDPERLRAALDALLENAIKYTREADAIELRAHRDGSGSVVIEVEDDGSGVPQEALERIFDRFGRADAARTRATGGVGLGLAIVDAIAKGHGGRCTVTSTADGSTFALHLPAFARATTSPLAQQPVAR